MKTRKIYNYTFTDVTAPKMVDNIIKMNNHATYHTNCHSVTQFYKKPSYYKTRAEIAILDEMVEITFNTEYDCSDYVITGGNYMYFSCTYRIYNKLNGNLLAIVYHTYANAYIVWVDED